jgi:starch phosphorylase
MNEGHCSFAGLERLAQTMEHHGFDLKTAQEILPRSTIFTTHTPVAAGHDEFTVEKVTPYLMPFTSRLGVDIEDILSWGKPENAKQDKPVLSMFVLGLRMSQYCNGVSRLHGRVARKMWAHVWPGRPEDEVPIHHITNGIHIPSWISVENAMLFERYLDPEWYMNTWNSEIVDRIDDIYDEELWRAHEMSRSRLIRTCRSLMIKQYSRRNAPIKVMAEAESVFDQEVLTIAFARRFATYKRANLLLQDPERFESIIGSDTHPVQFIFSGKAHPKDNEGKELIKKLIEFAKRPKVRHRIVFLEDYDIDIARYLVQGADVWLNTPRRPMEACGTSGIKAAVNGVLNVSILDGWWCEGYSDELGWRIGNGEEYSDHAYQDEVESQALYNIIENDVVPCFYDRKNGDSPTRWVKMMKASMKMAMKNFCANHMVNNYEELFYLPAIKQYRELTENNGEKACQLADKFERLKKMWPHVQIEPPVRKVSGPFRVGETIRITTRVHLGELNPDEVIVELYHGQLKSLDSLSASNTEPMTVEEGRGDGEYIYGCAITCNMSGRYGFTARVIPCGDQYIRYAPGLISWAK